MIEKNDFNEQNNNLKNNSNNTSGNIVIPKGAVKGLFLGIGITIILFTLIGLGAATFYVGTQNIDLQGAKIVNGATPSSDSDYATKGYVDSNAGLSSAWVSVGSTDCNGGYCWSHSTSYYYDYQTQMNADKLCADAGYVSASSYHYMAYNCGSTNCGSSYTCYKWDGDSWNSVTCSYSGYAVFYIDYVYCIS